MLNTQTRCQKETEYLTAEDICYPNDMQTFKGYKDHFIALIIKQ